jgi:alkyldihydroxyacetonephosphate synthase
MGRRLRVARRLAPVPVDRRKHWGWGLESQQPTSAQLRDAVPALADRLGIEHVEVEDPVPLERVRLGPSRVPVPAALARVASDSPYERAAHALGKSYVDVVNGFRGRFEHPPDFVARPGSEEDVERILEWCTDANVAVIPYGGGTSVVGGVTPDVGAGYEGAVSLDLSALRQVVEVDATSRAACIEAGALGPDLEEQLRPHGLTLRHFPQSFEQSTLGGWIATRAGGHFATLWTHIEDMVESVRAVTPTGIWESRRLPASGAGVSPDRMLAGSEGTLGVITRAWMRLWPRPSYRSSVGVRFADGFLAAAECVRALAQSGLNPANCRLLDAAEAQLTGAGDGAHAVLIVGFESADHPVAAQMRRALQICRDHGGEASAPSSSGDGAVGTWRRAFLGAPYLRDTLVAMGVLSETFESAITWERLPSFHSDVLAATEYALRELCGGGRVSCRFTHVYADGAALYFTVIAPARRGQEAEMWRAIKAAASDAIMRAGGTITHHHAVGRDHRPWYDRQRPEPFAAALSAAKGAVDPRRIMNPGVLVG